MIRNIGRRGARIATSLALAGALAWAPSAAFAADGDGAAGTDPAATPTPTTGPSAPVDGTGDVEQASTGETPVQSAPLPASDARVADGVLMNYVVNTTGAGQVDVDSAAEAVVAAGGVVLSEYPEIGVLTAQSADGGFLTAIREAPAVESAGPTRTAAVSTDEAVPRARAGTQGVDRPVTSRAVAADPLEADQWDMSAIGAPEARQITAGDPSVVVGVLDSGIDVNHPDLATQVDPSLSVGCAVNGVPDQSPSAWVPVDDSESHGTHVAGTIAAADNGVGIVGIAPGVTLASVKVVDYDGYIYPEYALCGFMWAADNGFDVTNNSYFVDPYAFWCQGDADQAPTLEALTRAVEYSESQGVLSVAAAGNSAYDLGAKTTDDESPNDSTAVTGRDVSQGCFDLPTEIDGVVTVSALREGADGDPFFDVRYSNYGDGVIDLGAPGTGILSTVFGGRYEIYDGTSMASPHVAGVAALLASTHPDASPAELRDLLASQAIDKNDPARYGAGVVNAFAAVTEDLGRGPVVAVADGTVQAGAPFRLRGANFVAGETVTIDGLAGEIVADGAGRLDDLAQLAATVPAGVTTLTLTGSEGSTATLELLVEQALASPGIIAPAAGSTVEPGTVTVTGTARPNAVVTVLLATADQFADLDEPAPAPNRVTRSARIAAGQDSLATDLGRSVQRGELGSASIAGANALDVTADPVPYDATAGGVVAIVQADVSGSFSVPVTGVPAGAFGVTALQTLSDGTTSTLASPVFFSATASAVVAPPVVTTPGADGVAPGSGGVAPLSSGVTPLASSRSTAALAATGSEPTPFAAAALAMVLAGLVIVLATRRRGRPIE